MHDRFYLINLINRIRQKNWEFFYLLLLKSFGTIWDNATCDGDELLLKTNNKCLAEQAAIMETQYLWSASSVLKPNESAAQFHGNLITNYEVTKVRQY